MRMQISRFLVAVVFVMFVATTAQAREAVGNPRAGGLTITKVEVGFGDPRLPSGFNYDTYYFRLNAGERIQVIMHKFRAPEPVQPGTRNIGFLGGPLRPHLILVDSNGRHVAQSNDYNSGWGPTAQLNFTAQQAGQFRVLAVNQIVNQPPVAQPAGEYKLRVWITGGGVAPNVPNRTMVTINIVSPQAQSLLASAAAYIVGPTGQNVAASPNIPGGVWRVQLPPGNYRVRAAYGPNAPHYETPFNVGAAPVTINAYVRP